MKNKRYIGIKKDDFVVDRLYDMGYKWLKTEQINNNSEWVFIIIVAEFDKLGRLVDGNFNNRTDIKVKFDDIPF